MFYYLKILQKKELIICSGFEDLKFILNDRLLQFIYLIYYL